MTGFAAATSGVPAEERLIFALDFPDAESALRMVGTLGDVVRFYKVGLELIAAGDGAAVVERLLHDGKKVFLDLKMFDVPQTVGAAVAAIARVRDDGASFVTVHGNDEMLEAAVREKGKRLKVLAVTALTSLDRNDLNDLGFRCSVEQLVLSRARRALELGCDGVVSSGLEARVLRDEFGDRLIVVTPGIRPVDNDDDQKRTVNVEQAFRNGADYIVVGRPIRLADDPRAAAEAIQRVIAGVMDGQAQSSQSL